MADGIHRTAHDVLPTLVQCDLDQSSVRAGGNHLDGRRLHRSIVEEQTSAELLDRRRAHDAGDFGQVRLRDLIRRVCQTVREISVVGQNQQTFGVAIEPTDVEEPLPAISDEVRQCPSGSDRVETTPRGLFSTRY